MYLGTAVDSKKWQYNHKTRWKIDTALIAPHFRNILRYELQIKRRSSTEINYSKKSSVVFQHHEKLYATSPRKI